MTVRIGCSGWQYRDWRGVLYPPGCPQPRWLQRYAEVFDTVEVNSTFYRLARRDAVARWVEQTPPGFLFALKASRYLIHMKKLTGIEQGIERFYERIEPLVGSPKLGPVLWQLPEWFARDDDRLAAVAREADAWVYFNNDWEGFAVRNGIALRAMLERAGVTARVRS